MLLIQQDCGFCDDAKSILVRLAAEYPLDISTIDINSPEGWDWATRGNIHFPPGIFLDGQPFSYGRPSERKLRSEFEARLARSVET